MPRSWDIIFPGREGPRENEGKPWRLLPAPDSCKKPENVFLQPPRPEEVLTVMSVIEGDSTPWSYLQASLFFRKIYEFGALWPGVDGDEHEIIYSLRGRDPSAYHYPETRSFREMIDSWDWPGKRPLSWKPAVIEHEGACTVRFYTYSDLEVCAIYLHEDAYVNGDYTSGKVREERIACGPRGKIF